ncbi:MAG: hypothetical protein ACR2NR_13535 [Solirubrobacteraceae bacterium]
MSDAWHSIKVREFEHLRASPSVILLRVSGTAGRRRNSGPRPFLLADNGHTVKRVAAIPSPPDGRGLLRAAYSVNSELISPSTVFSLECSNGSVVTLPAPTPGAARLEPPADTGRRPATPSATAAPREAERRSGLASKVTELAADLGESAQARTEHAAASVAARTEAEQAMEQLGAQQERLAELEAAAREADERATAADARAAEADERVRIAQEQADERARTMLAQEQEQVQARLAEVQTPLEQRAALAEQRADGAVLEAAAAQNEIQSLQTRHRELEAELSEHQRQAEDLDTWRSELERRLTDATDQLNEARTARERDEAELARMTAGLAQLPAANAPPAPEAASAKRVQLLYAERREIARQAEALAKLLGGAERLSELASELTQARAQVEGLQATAATYPAPGDELAADAVDNDSALSGARTELERLRIELAQARETATEAQEEVIREAAEAQAREQAEHELAEAAPLSA